MFKNKMFAGAVGLGILLSNLSFFVAITGLDFVLNATMVIPVCLGLAVWFMQKQQLRYTPSIMFWLGLFLLLALQPLINDIAYPDSHLFSVVGVLLCVFVAIVVASIEKKEQFLSILLGFILCAASLNFVIQCFQLFDFRLVVCEQVLTLMPPDNRLFGNLAQPNHLAYLSSMGLVATLYFQQGRKNLKINALLLVLQFIMGLSIAMTLSRSGFLLGLIAIVMLSWMYRPSMQGRARSLLLSGSVYAVAFFFYQQLVLPILLADPTAHAVGSAGIAGRFTEGTLYFRISQLQQAWWVFLDEPIRGSGWGNFALASLEHAEKIRWFSFSDHSHFILSHFAAELGVIGILLLVLLAGMVIRALLSGAFNRLKSTALCLVVMTGFYSCLEYPLWYMKFLIPFVVFLVLLEADNTRDLNPKLRPIIASVSLIIAILMVYYATMFLKFNHTNEQLFFSDKSVAEKNNMLKALRVPFGFSDYKEKILFQRMVIDNTNLETKLELAERVVPIHMSQKSFFNFARLHAYAGNNKKSLGLFKAACLFQEARYCQQASEALGKLALEEPVVYKPLYADYLKWQETRVLKQ